MVSDSRLSPRIAAIAESATLKVDAKAKARKAAGRPVVSYAAGEPDFDTPAHIVEAIHRVRAGEPMLSPTVTQQLIHAVSTRTSDTRERRAATLVSGLTDRERQIALAIGEGRTNADIAASLYLSVATVKSHVTHLLTKLEADNRVQIAIRMHDAGLL